MPQGRRLPKKTSNEAQSKDQDAVNNSLASTMDSQSLTWPRTTKKGTEAIWTTSPATHNRTLLARLPAKATPSNTAMENVLQKKMTLAV
jgi:hypothetical protein